MKRAFYYNNLLVYVLVTYFAPIYAGNPLRHLNQHIFIASLPKKINNTFSIQFVIRAQVANVIKNNDISFITLKNIKPTIFYLSRQPIMQAGKVSSDQFLMNWEKNITKNSHAKLAIVYEQIKSMGKATPALFVSLSRPKKINQTDWTFQLRDSSNISAGRHTKVVLFLFL